jgi:hypothetical protein
VRGKTTKSKTQMPGEVDPLHSAHWMKKIAISLLLAPRCTSRPKAIINASA